MIEHLTCKDLEEIRMYARLEASNWNNSWDKGREVKRKLESFIDNIDSLLFTLKQKEA